MEQIDVKTAFLNATSESIYIKIPEGLNTTGNMVLKLNKALYGIKQAPRVWNVEISNYLSVLNTHNAGKVRVYLPR